jgi:hypothetical protein
MPIATIHHVKNNTLDVFDVSLSKKIKLRIKKHNIEVRDHNGGE